LSVFVSGASLFNDAHTGTYIHIHISRLIEHYQPPPIVRTALNYKIHVNARSRCPINIRREAVFSRVPARRCFVKQIIRGKKEEEEEGKKKKRKDRAALEHARAQREHARRAIARADDRSTEELISNFVDGHPSSAEDRSASIETNRAYSDRQSRALKRARRQRSQREFCYTEKKNVTQPCSKNPETASSPSSREFRVLEHSNI